MRIALARVVIFVLGAGFAVLSWMLVWLVAYLLIQMVAQPWSWVLIMMSALTFGAFVASLATMEGEN